MYSRNIRYANEDYYKSGTIVNYGFAYTIYNNAFYTWVSSAASSRAYLAYGSMRTQNKIVNSASCHLKLGEITQTGGIDNYFITVYLHTYNPADASTEILDGGDWNTTGGKVLVNNLQVYSRDDLELSVAGGYLADIEAAKFIRIQILNTTPVFGKEQCYIPVISTQSHFTVNFEDRQLIPCTFAQVG